MKILVFSHFFPPEIGAAPMRIADHASRWVREGHHVTVITNIPNSPFGKFYKGYKNRRSLNEEYRGINVKRILTFPSGKRKNKFHRVLSFSANTFGSIIPGIVQSKPDIIIASAPYLSGIPGLIASFRHKVPLIYELRDPWVQVAASTSTVKRFSLPYKLLAGMERIIVHFAHEVVVIGEEMATYVQHEMKLKKKPFVVHNAIDIQNKVYEKKQIELPEAKGRFVIGSIGNMGSQYNFNAILEAAHSLSDEPYYFLFLGAGQQLEKIKQKAKSRKLKNIGFYSPVPSSEVDSWFKACHLTVVSMKSAPIFKVYLPLKVLGSMNTGTPVLFGGSGETQKVLEESGAGAWFPSGDSELLVQLIKKYSGNQDMLIEQGKVGIDFIQNRFNRDVMAGKYLDLIKAVIS